MNYLVRLLIIIALFLLVLFVAPILVGGKGYVLIAMGNITIESSVVFLVFTLAVLTLLGYLLVRLIRRGSLSFGKVTRWFGGRTSRAKEKAFYDGLYALALGDQETAKASFQKVQNTDFHGFHYVALGQLALQEGDEAKAKYWFDQADTSNDITTEKTIAVLLAQYCLTNNRASDALECLQGFEDTKDPTILKVRSQAMAQTQQWESLKSKLPSWKKPLGKDYTQVMSNVAIQQLSEIASKQGANQLKKHWDQLPRGQRKDPAYRLAFATQLLNQGMHEDVQQYLTTWFKSELISESMLDLVKQLRLPNPSPTISLLEKAIKQSPEDAKYYAALGHVAYYSNDSQLSERALAKAITMKETKAELMLLADIYQQNSAYDEAMQAMRRVADL